MNQDRHPLVTEYLARLRAEARLLPRASRTELLADIESHLAEATAADMPDAEVLTALDELGDPDEIVSAHSPDIPPGLGTRSVVQQWAAIFLLLFGWFVLGIGWIFGLILLWSSTVWRTREKLLGTLLPLGGPAAAYVVLRVYGGWSAPTCVVAAFTRQSVNLNGKWILMHRGQTLCFGGHSTVINTLELAGVITVAVLPVLVAGYLARRAGKATPVMV